MRAGLLRDGVLARHRSGACAGGAPVWSRASCSLRGPGCTRLRLLAWPRGGWTRPTPRSSGATRRRPPGREERSLAGPAVDRAAPGVGVGGGGVGSIARARELYVDAVELQPLNSSGLVRARALRPGGGRRRRRRELRDLITHDRARPTPLRGLTSLGQDHHPSMVSVPLPLPPLPPPPPSLSPPPPPSPPSPPLNAVDRARRAPGLADLARCRGRRRAGRRGAGAVRARRAGRRG